MEVNCETDFVARNGHFCEFVHLTAEALQQRSPLGGQLSHQESVIG